MTDNYRKRLIEPFLEYYRYNILPKTEKTEEILREKESVISQDGYFAIPSFTVLLTSYCTLRCKHCIRRIPHLKGAHVPLDSAIRSIDMILNAVDECATIEFTGGEIFLYPYLKELLRNYLDSNKFEKIFMVTTGTVPLDKDLWELLTHKKIRLYVNDYGCNLPQFTEFIHQLIDRDIDFEIRNSVKWIDFEGFSNKNKTKETMQVEYSRCYSAKFCKNLIFPDETRGGGIPSMFGSNYLDRK